MGNVSTFVDLINLVHDLGEILEKIGTVEKRTKKPINSVYTQFLEMLYDLDLDNVNLDCETAKTLLVSLLKLFSVSEKLNKRLDELSPSEKIKVGKTLKDFSDIMKKIL